LQGGNCHRDRVAHCVVLHACRHQPCRGPISEVGPMSAEGEPREMKPEAVAELTPRTARNNPRSQDPFWVRVTLCTLALLILTVLVVIPVISVFYEALADGLAKYWHNLTAAPDTRHAILLTLTVAPLAVLANIVFGVAAAWAITCFRFPGRTI